MTRADTLREYLMDTRGFKDSSQAVAAGIPFYMESNFGAAGNLVVCSADIQCGYVVVWENRDGSESLHIPLMSSGDHGTIRRLIEETVTFLVALEEFRTGART